MHLDQKAIQKMPEKVERADKAKLVEGARVDVLRTKLSRAVAGRASGGEKLAEWGNKGPAGAGLAEAPRPAAVG